MRWFWVVVVASLAWVVPACSSETQAGSKTAEDADEPDAPSGEEEDAGEPTGLEPTGETSAEADIGDVKRTLDRAQFGTTKDGDEETLYLEAHEGGVEACPETETPKRTMIVNGVPLGAVGDSFDEEDGVTVSFIDFEGDQITADNPTTKATKAKATLVAFTADDSVEIEIEATFKEGTVKGRVFATYCEAMSETK